jgi:hypothetical protein
VKPSSLPPGWRRKVRGFCSSLCEEARHGKIEEIKKLAGRKLSTYRT